MYSRIFVKVSIKGNKRVGLSEVIEGEQSEGSHRTKSKTVEPKGGRIEDETSTPPAHISLPNLVYSRPVARSLLSLQTAASSWL
jgi:hypothetical protein